MINIRKTTLKDVAMAAEVSVSTASRVLSGSTAISAETRERVRSEAKRLNYTLNSAARSLRCDRTRLIGVVFPDISGGFYAICASAILKYARKKDYAVLFTESGHNTAAEEKAVRALMERGVDGILFIGDNTDDEIVMKALESGIPVVTGDRHIEGIPSVTYNNRETIYAVTEQLYKSGCRSFVYVGEPTDGQNNLKMRHLGFTDFISSHSDIQAESILDSRFHGNKSKAGAELFFEKIQAISPDAIITSNDLIAIGIISAAHNAGINIPSDMSVTGFDDLSVSAYTIPPLSTIQQDITKLAGLCISMLDDAINKKPVQNSVITQKIISRESAELVERCKHE
ncbi:MAG: LacI family DNA-binding transcriptional regulator [Candidatus Ornithomonoglobus sp.]